LNTAYIVEVKSHAREDYIIQLKSILQRFRTFFPEHQEKQLYGILAAVDMSPELRQKTLQEGFYVARIHDQVFELDTPENFQPQSY
jgi:RecB family endonuclease NucS